MSSALVAVLGAAGCGDNGVAPPDAVPDAPLTPAVLAMSPPSADFGTTTINTTSSATSFTVTNSGQAESGTISAIAAGAAAADFDVSSTCSTLAGAGTCIVTVTFSPTTVGAKTAMLVVSGSPGGTIMANLSGAAIAPGALTIAPSGLHAFGDVIRGASGTVRNFVVTNSGGIESGTLAVTASGDQTQFTKTNDTCVGTLTAGETCAFDINFTPTTGASTGLKTASYTVSASPGGQVTASVSGNSIDAAQIRVVPTLAPFGGVLVGTTSPSTVTFTFANTGDQNTTALSAPVASPAGEYAIVAQNCTGVVLVANAANSCTVEVSFTPAATGARPGTLAVSATTGGTATATLSGTGFTAGALQVSPPTNPYGNVVVGQSSDFTYLVRNTGGAAQGPLTATSDSPDFTVVGGTTCNNATLAPNATCNVVVRFAPLSGGSKGGNLTVSGGTGGPGTAGFTGNGITAAAISVNPPSWDFGSEIVGASDVRIFTVRNDGGTATSAVPSAVISGSADFVANNTCTTTLAPLGTCNVTVTFTPSSVGPKTAVMNVTAGGNTVPVTLDGNGITSAQIAVNPGALAFDPTVLGESDGDQSFTLINNGSVTSGPISFGEAGANQADFAVVSTTCSTTVGLANGQSCSATVRFTPTAVGPRNASIVVNATPGGGASVGLTGTGVPRIEILNPATSPYDFGTVITDGPGEPNPAPTVTITLRNNTSASQVLNFTNLPATGPFFQNTDFCNNIGLDQCCANGVTLLPAGNILGLDSCSINVDFDPTFMQAGPATAMHTFSIGTGPFDTAVQQYAGIGNTNRLTITPDPAIFGSATAPIIVGNLSGPVVLTVRNQSMTATGPLGVLGLPFYFAVVSDMCSGTALPVNGTCTITVRYRPQFFCPNSLDGTGGPGEEGPSNSGDLITVRDSSGAVSSATSSFENYCQARQNFGVVATDGTDFGNVYLNEPVDSTVSNSDEPRNRTWTLTNNIDSTLPITVSLTGNSQFSRPAGTTFGGTCGANLVGPGSCTVIIRFNPVIAMVDQQAEAVLVINGQEFDLSGRPVDAFHIDWDTLDFNNVTIGGAATLSFEIHNVSNADIVMTSILAPSPEFTVVSACATVAPGTCPFTVTFTPTTPGPKEVDLTATAASGHGVDTVELLAFADASANLVIVPTTTATSRYNFGSVRVGQTSDQTFTVTNTGRAVSGALNTDPDSGETPVGPNALSSTRYSIVGDSCDGNTLAAGAECTVTIRFTPTATGVATATLEVEALAGATGSPADSASAFFTGAGLAATGTTTVTVAPSHFDFGPVGIGSTSGPTTGVFLVSNDTGTLADLSALAASSGDFARDDVGAMPPITILSSPPACGTTLATATQCQFRVEFRPTGTAGARSAAYPVAAGVTVGVHGVAVSPTGVSGLMALNFGNEARGNTTDSQTLTVTNTGTAYTGAITVAPSTAADADYNFSGTCNTNDLAPGETCTVIVEFAPFNNGTRAYTIPFTSTNGINTSFSVTGVGFNNTELSITLVSGGADDGARPLGRLDTTPSIYSVTNMTGQTLTSDELGIDLDETLGSDNFVLTTVGVTNPCLVTFPGTRPVAFWNDIGTTLAAGASCNVGILFHPTEFSGSGSAFSTNLDFNDQGGATYNPSSSFIGLTGTSTEPVTATTPVSLGTVTRDIVFTNNSSVPTSPLNTALLGTNADMVSIITDGCLGMSVAAGGMCTISVRLVQDINQPPFASAAVRIRGTIAGNEMPFADDFVWDIGIAGDNNGVVVDLIP